MAKFTIKEQRVYNAIKKLIGTKLFNKYFTETYTLKDTLSSKDYSYICSLIREL